MKTNRKDFMERGTMEKTNTKIRLGKWIYGIIAILLVGSLVKCWCSRQACENLDESLATGTAKCTKYRGYYGQSLPAIDPTAPSEKLICRDFADEEILVIEKREMEAPCKVVEDKTVERPCQTAKPVEEAPGAKNIVGGGVGYESSEQPTQGELRAIIDDKEVPLPLNHTDVKAKISAFVATVNVLQKYSNPYGEKIEAVYVFPLPENAAVTDFIMTIGTRKIRGIIREREEARKIYEDAKRQGYRAALLTQERPNIFTQRVANIEPGKKIDVDITYFNTLAQRDGKYRFVFPMVVGPRYNPHDCKDGIGAVAQGTPGKSGQPTEVQYLKPGQRSGHDIALSIELDAGMKIENIESPTHAVKLSKTGDTKAAIKLSENDQIPNRDFVLTYSLAGDRTRSGFLTHKSENGGTFALVLQPPADLNDLPRMPREMIFVVDCSGSMQGRPLEIVKDAMRRCLRNLDQNDSFQIIRFSTSASALGNRPLEATPENVKRGLAYIDELSSEGGTEMIEGIKAALGFEHDQNRLRIVSFMTDGYIGNEDEILREIDKRLGSARIFSFGVGSSVNRYLMEAMARVGNGAVAYIGLGESVTAEVDRFYDRAARAALVNIKLDFGDVQASDIFPRRIPDLFVGRPVIVTGKFNGDGKTTVTLSGLVGGKEVAQRISVDLSEAGEHAGIEHVWARAKLAELAQANIMNPSKELTDAIIQTSIRYKVLSGLTAFLAVDGSQKTAGNHGTTVAVPVPMPEGIRYETTVMGN